MHYIICIKYIMISKYISIPIFLGSFIIGLFCIYFMGPEQKIVYMYPNLDNYTKLQYKDKANQCFELKPVAVDCPINPLSIKTMPIQ
jgi:hypothetical protein